MCVRVDLCVCVSLSWVDKKHRYNNSLERNGMHRYTMDITYLCTLTITAFFNSLHLHLLVMYTTYINAGRQQR